MRFFRKFLRKFAFKSLKTKLLIGFLTIIILSVSYSAYNSVALKNIDRKANNMIDQQLPALILNEKLQINVSEQISLTRDRKSTRLNSSHVAISYAVFCL